MARFEKIEKYKDSNLPLPVRKTAGSAGYDFTVAEDVVIPSYLKLAKEMFRNRKDGVYSLDEMTKLTKSIKAKPTLVPTGIKCYLDKNQYLELSVRSSCPLKYWLILANGVGIIDSDYVDNPDNEGHIFFQIINLSPLDIQLKKGDIIGQGIIKNYETVEEDCPEQEARAGGFGSTSRDKVDFTRETKQALRDLIMSIGNGVSVNGLK